MPNPILVTQHAAGPSGQAVGLYANFGGLLDRRRVAVSCAILLTLEIAFFLFTIALSHGWIIPISQPTTTDFASFYAAGVLANAGTPQLAYNEAAHFAAEQAVTSPGIEYQYFYYPPVFLMLCAALAHLPYMAAFLVFQGVTLFLYLSVAQRILDDRSSTALLVLLAFPAVFWNLGLGQTAFLVAALFGAATLLIDQRPVIAGALFGMLCFKPHFALLVPLALAAAGRWRSVAGAAASCVVLALASVAVFGWQTWHDFLVAASASPEMYASGRIKFAGFASPFGAVRLLGGSISLAYSVQIAISLIAASVVFVVWRCGLSLAVRAATLAAATLVALPLSLVYDLMLAAIAAAWLVRGEGPRRGVSAAEKATLAGLFLLVITTRFLPWLWHVPVAPAAALGLFAMVTWRAVRELVQTRPALAFWQRGYSN